MDELKTFSTPQSRGVASTVHDLSAADALVAAIRRPLDALDGAAEEAANGMLGRAKLGLLVAANGLIAALDVVDAEFARQYAAFLTPGRPGRRPDRHQSDETDNVTHAR